MKIGPLPIHIFTDSQLDTRILEAGKAAAVLTRQQTNAQISQLLYEVATLRKQLGMKQRRK